MEEGDILLEVALVDALCSILRQLIFFVLAQDPEV
jgi:hypothetical protein